MDAVAEIKSRISIEELVSQYVQLKKVGRNFRGLCPFHNEKTPSFYVSPERQMAYCFGCHKGGDHFTFIQEVEGIEFRAALEMLAERAHVELPKAAAVHFGPSKDEKNRLVSAHEKATEFFEDQLWNTKEGGKVLSYLKKRGLAEETIKQFHIGFAPDASRSPEESLSHFLLKQNFTAQEILAAGLAFPRETTGGGLSDRFRMRAMFPIKNISGDICGFGGRAVKEGDEPKYLNSPETPIYHKSGVLFGLSEARAQIRAEKKVIVVEGYMDAIALIQAGFKNVVATSGTALTPQHLELIKRSCQEVIFSFDQDNAGHLATERALEMALETEMTLRIAVWQGQEKDPDECVKKNPQIFRDAVEKALPASEYLLMTAGQAADKKAAVQKLLPYWSKVKNSIDLEEWLKKSSSALQVSITSLYDELKRFRGQQKIPQKTFNKAASHETDSNPASYNKETVHHEYLVGLLLTQPELISIVNQFLSADDLTDPELQNIYRSLTTQYNQLSEQEAKRSEVLKLLIETQLPEASIELIREELSTTLHTLLIRKSDREKRDVLGRIKTADETSRQELLQRYQDLLEDEKKLPTYGQKD